MEPEEIEKRKDPTAISNPSKGKAADWPIGTPVKFCALDAVINAHNEADDDDEEVYASTEVEIGYVDGDGDVTSTSVPLGTLTRRD